MEITVQHIIANSIKKAMTYNEYRLLVSKLLEEGKSTGPEQSQSLLDYSKLNDRRMHRLDKTIKIPEDAANKIKSYSKKVTWLVISEGWCGDSAQTLPVINKVASLNENISLKIVLRDEHPDLMDAFLTNGSRAIPKLIMIDDESQEIIDTWGPRPSVATKMVKEFKAQHGALTPEFKQDLQIWYNKDKGESTVNDLLQLLSLE